MYLVFLKILNQCFFLDSSKKSQGEKTDQKLKAKTQHSFAVMIYCILQLHLIIYVFVHKIEKYENMYKMYILISVIFTKIYICIISIYI